MMVALDVEGIPVMSQQTVQDAGRSTAAMVLGLIGGSIGLLSGVAAVFAAGQLGGHPDAAAIQGQGLWATVLGLAAVTAGALVKVSGRGAGWVLIVVAVAGLFVAPLWWLIGAVLMTAGGVVAVRSTGSG